MTQDDRAADLEPTYRFVSTTDELQFNRLVRFELQRIAVGTRLHASVDATIRGLPASVVRRSATVEQRALERSLDRLAHAAEGRRRSLWARWRDGQQSPQVL